VTRKSDPWNAVAIVTVVVVVFALVLVIFGLL
jgi:hypothetical protein